MSNNINSISVTPPYPPVQDLPQLRILNKEPGEQIVFANGLKITVTGYGHLDLGIKIESQLPNTSYIKGKVIVKNIIGTTATDLSNPQVINTDQIKLNRDDEALAIGDILIGYQGIQAQGLYPGTARIIITSRTGVDLNETANSVNTSLIENIDYRSITNNIESSPVPTVDHNPTTTVDTTAVTTSSDRLIDEDREPVQLLHRQNIPPGFPGRSVVDIINEHSSRGFTQYRIGSDRSTWWNNDAADVDLEIKKEDQ